MPQPCRRSFLAAVALAGPLAAAAPPPAVPPRPDLERHDSASAAADLCFCRACMDERVARGSHPLHAAAIVAAYRAGDALLTLHYTHGCRVDDWHQCEACADGAFMARAVDWLVAVLESEYCCRTGNPVERQRRESRLLRADLAELQEKDCPAPTGRDHPAQEAAAIALLNLRDALAALARIHDQAELVEDAEAGAYLAEMFSDLLSGSIVPSATFIRRRFPELDAERRQLLDALEREERAETGPLNLART